MALIHLLLMVTVAELALNRLAVPALRPPGDEAPPGWHQVLDHLGLFLMYFASTLALGVLLRRAWRLLRERGVTLRPLALLLALGIVGFTALAAVNIATSPGEKVGFAFETLFALFLLVLTAAQLTSRADLGVKVGMVLLVAPLLVHYYGPFSVRYIAGPEALWTDLPERVLRSGHWTMMLAALASPYCFAPRPFLRSAARLGPVVVALFVGVLGVVIVRQHYEVGMLLASRGLGIDLGPGAPQSFLALNLLALATITWTLTACFTAESPARREIGVGLGLVVLGGYGFSWPLQYLVSAVGLLQITDAAASARRQEREGAERRTGFSAPPIADEVWQSFVAALVGSLREPALLRDGAGERSADEPSTGAAAQAVTATDDHGLTVTTVVATRRGLDVRVRVERYQRSILSIEVQCGRAPAPGTEPAWTLYARPERLLGMGAHPEPPEIAAPAARAGDAAFDQRFRIRDAGDLTAALLDEGLRARATAFIDGWLAFWPERGLRYRVHPGRGAPLDHPIPITELAFRGQAGDAAGDRLVTLLDLLVDIGLRALPSPTPDDTGEPAA